MTSNPLAAGDQIRVQKPAEYLAHLAGKYGIGVDEISRSICGAISELERRGLLPAERPFKEELETGLCAVARLNQRASHVLDLAQRVVAESQAAGRLVRHYVRATSNKENRE